MAENKSTVLGTQPIGKLLTSQALPAAIGIMIMSIYMIVDTIFVGHYVNSFGIAALTVVMPITFLIASVGMAIGIGGASIISRALGANNRELAWHTFGNQVGLTVTMGLLVVLIGSFFETEILTLFGGKGQILPYAREYYRIVLWGVPFLSWAMMANNVLRAVGLPKVAMMIMIIPAVANVILDPILIIVLDMGMSGAAWATAVSYFASASFGAWYLLSGRTEMQLKRKFIRPNLKITAEMFSIGGVTLVRQSAIGMLYLVANRVLLTHGGEMGIAVFGVLSRVMMFANFPVMGVTQGFLPIAGFNYGAENWDRVKQVIKLAVLSGTAISLLIFAGIMIFPEAISSLFSTEADLIAQAAPAMTIVFLATPLITIQLIGSAYYQAIGKALPALLLTLTKQGFFLIPLILILPEFYGLNGVWYAFPIADSLAALVTLFFLWSAYRNLNKKIDLQTSQAKPEPIVLQVESKPIG